MKRKEARAWHNRALQYLRSAEAERAAAEAVGHEAAVAPIDISIATESYPDGNNRVVVKVQSENEQTLHAVEVMRAEGAIPPDAPVEFIGRMRGLGPGDMVSPVQPGVCCAHKNGSRGTLGCVVKKSGAARFLVSANHVIALEDTVDPGTIIVQPVSGAEEVRNIATLERAVRLVASGNLMDAAIALFTVNDIDPVVFNGKSITAVRTTALKTGDRVFKFGQTTHERSGTVLSPVISNIKIDMNISSYKFDEQIEIESPAGTPFADGGDSGALVYDDRDEAVGIVIGGNGTTRTYVTPLQRILKKFEVTLA